jgi:hypothetical protein
LGARWRYYWWCGCLLLSSVYEARRFRLKTQQPAGEPMMLGNMRHLGVHHLVATCLNDACRHQGLIEMSKYPDDTPVPSFASKIVCAKCGARGRHIDVRPNWKEQPERPTMLRND